MTYNLPGMTPSHFSFWKAIYNTDTSERDEVRRLEPKERVLLLSVKMRCRTSRTLLWEQQGLFLAHYKP